MRATQQDGSYPRPTIVRDQWTSLDGAWEFAFDDSDGGLAARWFDADSTASNTAFDREIQVPYPFEAPASGVGERDCHPVVWYRRRVADVPQPAVDGRVLLHFGAVDFRAQVWFDGQLVAAHVGGQTPFTADVTDALDRSTAGSDTSGSATSGSDTSGSDTSGSDASGSDTSGPDASGHVVVVRVEDDPTNLEQPRGKQDWREQPHGIWYDRTTGIWQSVWLEAVGANHLIDVAWTPDLAASVVHGELTLNRTPARALRLELTLTLDDEVLAEQTVVVTDRTTKVDVVIAALRHGQERARLLWTPEHPALVDVEVVLRERGSDGRDSDGRDSEGRDSDGRDSEGRDSEGHDSEGIVDSIASYLGLRSASVGSGTFLLNESPYYVRSVLDQGFRPQTHLASTGSDELRTEVELMKAMGFNAVRVHQKAEDPRFLYWTDRLGLLVWGETAAAYAFSPIAIELLIAEWMELVRRDRSHPSIVTWVPVNESWGLQDIAANVAQQQYARALANLTRAVDPSRPVVSNDGWEHVDSDILGLHDYTTDPELFRARWASRQSVLDVVLSAHGPQGRRPMVTASQEEAFLAGRAPLMITEFGGVSLSDDKGAWGYEHVGSDSEYASLLLALFEALRSSTEVMGFCYTQFMDTGQETNGLLYADGRPKISIEAIRHIVTGVKDGSHVSPGSTFGWTD